jgi:hypothetical protein
MELEAVLERSNQLLSPMALNNFKVGPNQTIKVDQIGLTNPAWDLFSRTFLFGKTKCRSPKAPP